MKHIILGAGEIAKAIAPHLAGDCAMYDRGEWEARKDTCDMLHICIPYSKAFHDIVTEAISRLQPEILVIHSTVSPGTTKKIQFVAKLYSPVNGRHSDDFSENITLYPKIFAGDKETFIRAESAFRFVCRYWSDNTDELEFSKINCTNYMYWNLAFEKIIHKLCVERGYNFDRIYTEWNDMYNKGIDVMHSDWKRPVYQHSLDEFPGGHCLRPNIHLDDNFISYFLKRYEEGRIAII